jgi:hypothetical protein
MAQCIFGNEKCPDLTYDDGYRSYLITGRTTPSDYRVARTLGKRVRVHAQTVLNRFNGFLKSMLEASVAAKMRRVERALKVRGMRYQHHKNEWTQHSSGQAATVSKD